MRQVLGHLVVAADPPTGRFVYGSVPRPGEALTSANDRLAVAEALRPMKELLAAYRARLDTQKTPPGFGPSALLTDVLLHSLDVRIPLGLPTERPPERYQAALDLLLSEPGTAGLRSRGPPERPLDRHRPQLGLRCRRRGARHDGRPGAGGVRARCLHLDALSGRGQPALAAWLLTEILDASRGPAGSDGVATFRVQPGASAPRWWAWDACAGCRGRR